MSVLIVVILLFTRRILISLIAKNVKDPKTVYNSKRSFLLIILLGSVWITGFGSIGAYLGIASAGIASASRKHSQHRRWFFILWRKPFVIGDRIQIGDTKGDVIDLRLFQFSLV